MSKKSPGNTTLLNDGVLQPTTPDNGRVPLTVPDGGDIQQTMFESGRLPLTIPAGGRVPFFDSEEAVRKYLQSDSRTWEDYLGLPKNMRQELIGFCMGKNGLRITYDTVFRKIFDPMAYPERLQALLSAVLGRKVRIVKIMPREGTQLSERAGFVIMDVLVQLDDGSYANVEMQKLGYDFPISRADCYASDIILRQYTQVKAVRGDEFSFDDLHKVYCIVLMEKSPGEFHTQQEQYVHRRTASFDTGIYKENSGLHEDIFICLDSFHENVHTITKDSKKLDAWMTFLSAVELNEIDHLVRAFPEFLTIYQEIAAFIRKPEEVLRMLSEALYIMDRNMEYKMARRAKEEAEEAKKVREIAQKEAEAAQKEAEAAQKEAEAAQKEAEAAQKEAEAAKRVKEIAQKEAEAAKRVKEIAQKEAEAAQKEAEAANKRAEAIQKEAEKRESILRLAYKGHSVEEIAQKLAVPSEEVQQILAEEE